MARTNPLKLLGALLLAALATHAAAGEGFAKAPAAQKNSPTHAKVVRDVRNRQTAPIMPSPCLPGKSATFPSYDERRGKQQAGGVRGDAPAGGGSERS